MHPTTQNMTTAVSALWQSVIGNGVLIADKLKILHTTVERQQEGIKEKYTKPVFEKLYVSGDALKEGLKGIGFYNTLKDSTIDIATLRSSFEAMEVSDQATVNAFVGEVNKALDELLKNSTNQYLIAVKNSTQQTIQALTDFVYYLSQEAQPDLKERVDGLLQAIADWVEVVARLDEPQKAYVLSMLQRSELVVSLLSHYRDPAPEPHRPEPSRYERVQRLREDLPKAEAEIKKGKLPNRKDVKDLHLAEFFDKGMAFTEIQSYRSVQEVTQQLREAVSGFFCIIDKVYADNAAVAPYLAFAEQQIVHWLTLPADFRPENWVEVIHFIVNHIQYTLESISDPSFARVNAMVLPVLGRLDALLSEVNNEDFKLLITPKESMGIWDIELPDIMDEDEDEEEEKDEMPQALLSAAPPSHEAPRLESENSEPLTYNNVIEFLCFDENFGAMAKLDEDYQEVIYALYYNHWLGSRRYAIESDLYAFVEKNSLDTLLEGIKNQVLAEGGVNIGAFVDYLIDQVVAVVNNLIDLIKDTIHFIIDELFKLVKTLIAFFKDIDLPPVAKKALKLLPPFEKIPEDVTLLHVIAAIPYTLYQEFFKFEPALQVA